jgi:long-chain fatty acid transport protein
MTHPCTPDRLARRSRGHGRLAAIGFLGAVTLAPGIAQAGGFDIPGVGSRGLGRGGANVVGVQDISAVHYNPAALAKMRGTTITWNQTLVFHDTTFARAPLGQGLPDPAAAWGADAGTEFPLAESSDKFFPLGVMAGVHSDFGLENWTFAAALHGPQSVGRLDYPDYGPQSFQLTSLDALLAYYTVGAAWKWRDKVGVGATVTYVDLIHLRYALVVDSTVTPGLSPLPDAASTQLITELDLEDRANATAGLGIWYRPHERVEIAASSRIIPVFLEPEGTVNVDKPELVSDDLSARLKMQLPAIVRGGVRYIHDTGEREWFDLELDAVYENWASTKRYDIDFEGTINGQPVGDVSLVKNWRDTVSIRLGGDFNAIPEYLTVRAGGFFETGAMQKNYSHVDFPSFHRGGFGGGFSAGARGVYFTAGYQFVLQEKRTITELAGKVFQERPLSQCPEECGGASGVPANAGTFESRYHILSLGLDLRFRELLAKRRERRQKAKEATPPQAADAAPADAAGDEDDAAAEPDATKPPADATPPA